jgi:rhodanese-related sulfurtransferase
MVKMIGATEVRNAIEQEPDVVVLDVLAPESFANRHVPGAQNADVHAPDFEERAQRLAPDKAAPVVVYCAGMDCSASTKAAQRLERLGYRDVREFKAGLEGWKDAGYEFQRQPIRRQADVDSPSETAAPA